MHQNYMRMRWTVLLAFLLPITLVAQKMPGIDDAGRVVDHQPDTRERGFASYLDEKVIGPKELLRRAEYRNTGVQHELLAVFHFYFARFGVYLFYGIDDVRDIFVVYYEFIAEAYVVTRGLKLRSVERFYCDAAFGDVLFNVDVGEEHKEVYSTTKIFSVP